MVGCQIVVPVTFIVVIVASPQYKAQYITHKHKHHGNSAPRKWAFDHEHINLFFALFSLWLRNDFINSFDLTCVSVTPYGVIYHVSTVTEVTAGCLTAPSHYQNQCWYLANEFFGIHPKTIFQRVPRIILCIFSLIMHIRLLPFPQWSMN